MSKSTWVAILSVVILMTFMLNIVAPHRRPIIADQDKLTMLEQRITALEESNQYTLQRWDEVRKTQLIILDLFDERM